MLDVHSVNALGVRPEIQRGLRMERALPHQTETGNEQIVLGLLNALEADGTRSQRYMAAELGIALGLVNAYLKRCVKKGWVKVNEAPARRYAYYLTPQGFAEKSRLTVDYFSASFSFFRRAKSDCEAVFAAAKALGFRDVVLSGKSDLAEIAVLCAAESGVKIVALVDATAGVENFVGLPVVKDLASVTSHFDLVVLTDVVHTQATLQASLAVVSEDRILIPALLGVRRPAGGSQ